MKDIEKKIVAILKNKDKFCNIKLAKGIFMDNFNSYNRFENKTQGYGIGVSTLRFGKKWYILPKGKAIFKTYDGFAGQLKNIRIVNELVCSELCKQIDLDCATYEQASLYGQTGVVSYDIAKYDEKLIDGEMLKKISGVNEKSSSISIYSKAIDNLKKKNIKIDKKNILKELYKIALFDTLTFQTDRHDNNILFAVNENENSLKPTKLIDNEFAFLTLLLPQIQYASTFDNVLNTYVDYAKFNRKVFSVDGFKSYKKLVSGIVKLAKNDEELKTILVSTLTNINVEKAFENVEEMGNKISPDYKKYVSHLVDYSKQCFIDEIKNYKIKTEENKNKLEK